MAHLILDVETTTLNKGDPFNPNNRLCSVGWKTKDSSGVYRIEYDLEPYGAQIAALQHLINIHDTIVTFNGKFDLHWLRRYGIAFNHKKIWDVQLAYYIYRQQAVALPSLNDVGTYFGFKPKDDKIAQYWNDGIDTPQIPWNELSEYNLYDVELTEKCYLELLKLLNSNPAQERLLSVSNNDLLALEEMEWNGMVYDKNASLAAANDIDKEMRALIDKMCLIVDHPDVWKINWNSPEQVSAILYGGEVNFKIRESYIFKYKDGREAEKQRNAIHTAIFPRLVTPNENAATEKTGVWSVGDPIIKNLKAVGKAKQLIESLRHYNKLEKLHGTYLVGIPSIMEAHSWGNVLHGQLNQTIARTGRLSSSKPNMQNMPGDVDKFFISRFKDGLLVQFDVKGLEVVAAAFLSQDAVLLKELKEGEDIHSNNQAAFKLHDRLTAKRFMFKMIYGGTANGFANDADFQDLKMSVKRWQQVIDDFYAKYRSIEEWHKYIISHVLRNKSLSVPSGRIFNYTELLKRPEWYYVPKIKNYPVQGFGADIVMMARASLFNRLRRSQLSAKLVNTIHDSIILDIEAKDWYNISTLVKEVFNDLPTNLKNLWNINLGLVVSVEASNLTTGEDIK